MDQVEHNCQYANMIRANCEWIYDGEGVEVCAFCHTRRFTKVTRVIAERGKNLKSRDQITKEIK